MKKILTNKYLRDMLSTIKNNEKLVLNDTTKLGEIEILKKENNKFDINFTHKDLISFHYKFKGTEFKDLSNRQIRKSINKTKRHTIDLEKTNIQGNYFYVNYKDVYDREIKTKNIKNNIKEKYKNFNNLFKKIENIIRKQNTSYSYRFEEKVLNEIHNLKVKSISFKKFRNNILNNHKQEIISTKKLYNLKVKNTHPKHLGTNQEWYRPEDSFGMDQWQKESQTKRWEKEDMINIYEQIFKKLKIKYEISDEKSKEMIKFNYLGINFELIHKYVPILVFRNYYISKIDTDLKILFPFYHKMEKHSFYDNVLVAIKMVNDFFVLEEDLKLKKELNPELKKEIKNIKEKRYINIADQYSHYNNPNYKEVELVIEDVEKEIEPIKDILIKNKIDSIHVGYETYSEVGFINFYGTIHHHVYSIRDKKMNFQYGINQVKNRENYSKFSIVKPLSHYIGRDKDNNYLISKKPVFFDRTSDLFDNTNENFMLFDKNGKKIDYKKNIKLKNSNVIINNNDLTPS